MTMSVYRPSSPTVQVTTRDGGNTIFRANPGRNIHFDILEEGRNPYEQKNRFKTFLQLLVPEAIKGDFLFVPMLESICIKHTVGLVQTFLESGLIPNDHQFVHNALQETITELESDYKMVVAARTVYGDIYYMLNEILEMMVRGELKTDHEFPAGFTVHVQQNMSETALCKLDREFKATPNSVHAKAIIDKMGDEIDRKFKAALEAEQKRKAAGDTSADRSNQWYTGPFKFLPENYSGHWRDCPKNSVVWQCIFQEKESEDMLRRLAYELYKLENPTTNLTARLCSSDFNAMILPCVIESEVEEKPYQIIFFYITKSEDKKTFFIQDANGGRFCAIILPKHSTLYGTYCAPGKCWQMRNNEAVIDSFFSDTLFYVEAMYLDKNVVTGNPYHKYFQGRANNLFENYLGAISRPETDTIATERPLFIGRPQELESLTVFATIVRIVFYNKLFPHITSRSITLRQVHQYYRLFGIYIRFFRLKEFIQQNIQSLSRDKIHIIQIGLGALNRYIMRFIDRNKIESPRLALSLHPFEATVADHGIEIPQRMQWLLNECRELTETTLQHLMLPQNQAIWHQTLTIEVSSIVPPYTDSQKKLADETKAKAKELFACAPHMGILKPHERLPLIEFNRISTDPNYAASALNYLAQKFKDIHWMSDPSNVLRRHELIYLVTEIIRHLPMFPIGADNSTYYGDPERNRLILASFATIMTEMAKITDFNRILKSGFMTLESQLVDDRHGDDVSFFHCEFVPAANAITKMRLITFKLGARFPFFEKQKHFFSQNQLEMEWYKSFCLSSLNFSQRYEDWYEQRMLLEHINQRFSATLNAPLIFDCTFGKVELSSLPTYHVTLTFFNHIFESNILVREKQQTVVEDLVEKEDKSIPFFLYHPGLLFYSQRETVISQVFDRFDAKWNSDDIKTFNDFYHVMSYAHDPFVNFGKIEGKGVISSNLSLITYPIAAADGGFAGKSENESRIGEFYPIENVERNPQSSNFYLAELFQRRLGTDVTHKNVSIIPILHMLQCEEKIATGFDRRERVSSQLAI